MPDASWTSPLAASADPVRAAFHLRQLEEAIGAPRLDALRGRSRQLLAAVLAGSAVLPSILVRHPDWFGWFEDPESLAHPRRKEGLVREVNTWLPVALDRAGFTAALERLHDFRLREQFRIAVRDLAHLAQLPEVMVETSNAADVFLDGVLQVVSRQLTARLGTPWHRDPDGRWRQTALSMVGLGKLGGQELNHSSDVDLLFVYAEEGDTFSTPPKGRTARGRGVPNHEFFRRLVELFVHEASRRGVEEGALRVDLRLRPEGDAGPLARSLDSYENFYAAWGQSWERLMLLKARMVAGDPELGSDFVEVIQPFRYPRSGHEGLLEEMDGMKRRHERELVTQGTLERDVKLGRGGIREIEFTAQALQVLHGGRNPFLQTPQTLAALQRLSDYQVMPRSSAAALANAYRFLRDLEHRLQMEALHQTHAIPSETDARRRVARLMGFTRSRDFDAACAALTRRVSAAYRAVFHPGRKPGPQPGSEGHPQLPDDFSDPEPWKTLMLHAGLRDTTQALRLLREFVEGPGFSHVSQRTSRLALRLIPRFLELCPGRHNPFGRGRRSIRRFQLSDPDRVLARLDAYIQAYGPRASLYELWAARPTVLGHLLRLFDRSEHLAERALRSPDLIDDLESGGHLRRHKTADQTLDDLRHGASDPDQHLWLRRYFGSESLRIGLRDILGLIDHTGASSELTALAEACLRYVLEAVARRHRLATPPFAAIGLGRLGGGELGYGSDLDLLLVAPDSARNLPRLQKLAAECLDLLGRTTESGLVFTTDLRLRPDGEKGLLVNTLAAHEDYYRKRAGLWEIQALTRARWIAGNEQAGRGFESLARRLTDFTGPQPIAAWTPGWRTEIHRMRQRIARERTPVGREADAFKTGEGGLMDLEFLAQALAMAGGWFEPNTGRALERAAHARALPSREANQLLRSLGELQRVESILRRWSFAGEDLLPNDPAALERVARRCGQPDPRRFREDLSRCRAGIRAIYQRHLDEGPE